MALFTSPRNERLAIITIGCIALIIIGCFVYFAGCTRKSVKVGGIEINSEQVTQSKEDVKEKMTEFKEQLKTISSIPTGDIPTILKDSIATLLYIRQKDINLAEELLSKFEQFNGLSNDEKVSLMENVLKYLSKKSNPNRYVDFGDIAKTIVSSNKVELLTVANKKKEKEIEKLNNDFAQLENDKKRIELLYANAQNKIEENNRILAMLRKDSANNSIAIDSLNSRNSLLNQEKSKLKEEMKNTDPIRVTNCSFTSPGCRSKKDGSYVVGCMKSVEIKFVINYNIHSIKNKNELIKIVFTLPTSDPSKYITAERKSYANIGEESKVIFDDPNYKYVPGLYVVQLFYDKTSVIIPIEIKNLTAKNWWSK